MLKNCWLHQRDNTTVFILTSQTIFLLMSQKISFSWFFVILKRKTDKFQFQNAQIYEKKKKMNCVKCTKKIVYYWYTIEYTFTPFSNITDNYR